MSGQIQIIMKIRFYRWYNVVLTTLLAMLGFEGCDGIGKDEYGCPYMEYGCPNVHYQVKGTVTDTDGKPIKGIKVKIEESYEDLSFCQDSILTDNTGKYETRVIEDFTINDRMRIVFEDIDGATNGGEFQSDTLSVASLEKKQVEEDSGWYSGTYELKGDVTLKQKAEN